MLVKACIPVKVKLVDCGWVSTLAKVKHFRLSCTDKSAIYTAVTSCRLFLWKMCEVWNQQTLLSTFHTCTQSLHETSWCISGLSLSSSLTHTHSHAHTNVYTACVGCTHALEYRINDLVCGPLHKSAALAYLSLCVCICRRVKFGRRLLNHSCIFAHSLSSNNSHTVLCTCSHMGHYKTWHAPLLSSVEFGDVFWALQGPPKVVACRNEYCAKVWMRF